MNNTFKISRLQLLLRKQWIENKKIYFATSAILFGLLALLYAFNILTHSFVTRQNLEGTNEYNYFLSSFSSLTFRDTILAISGMFYLCLLSGHYFSNLGKASTAIQELSLPVSKTEKLVCSFLLSVVLTILTFIISFLIVDIVAVSILKDVYKEINFDEIAFNQGFGFDRPYGFKFFLQTLDMKSITIMSLIGLLLSSVFILGSVYFPRFSFIKTSFLVVLFAGVIALSVTSLDRLIKEGKVSIGNVSNDNMIKVFVAVFILSIVVSIWSAIYFRLKEKEV